MALLMVSWEENAMRCQPLWTAANACQSSLISQIQNALVSACGCVLFFFGLGMQGGRGAQISGLRYILTPVGHERPQAAHLHTYPYPACCHVAMPRGKATMWKATAGGGLLHLYAARRGSRRGNHVAQLALSKTMEHSRREEAAHPLVTTWHSPQNG